LSGYLRLEHLVKRFGSTVAADGVSLSLERGKILALLGPSGSGKTTILRLLAGFERPDAGRITVHGEDVTGASPVSRRFGMVFQHYALFPHLDAGQNVAFGLESLGVKGVELRRRTAEALALVDLSGFERRRIGELSGGQQQRVALARALAPEPRVLLLDEPLSNLDPSLRERTRIEMRELVRRVGITTVIVTHEQEEAFALGDLVAVIRRGRVEQIGTPEDLYGSPQNSFVAGFVGRASSVTGSVVAARTGIVRIRIENAEWDLSSAWSDPPNESARVMIRPEALRLVLPSSQVLSGKITARRFTGAQAFFTITTAGGAMVEVSAEPEAANLGDSVGLVPRDRGIHVFELAGNEPEAGS